MKPQTRYTQKEDINIAYQIIGKGPVDHVTKKLGFPISNFTLRGRFSTGPKSSK